MTIENVGGLPGADVCGLGRGSGRARPKGVSRAWSPSLMTVRGDARRDGHPCAARAHRSITLEADGRHLMTDVWTSAGVIAGVAAVALTGVERLDPVIALAVAANIVWTGIGLMRRSVGGLMDSALGDEEQDRIRAALRPFELQGVRFHALRIHQARRRAFISLHVLVPRAWSVQRGHDEVKRVETALRDRLPHATVFTHLEPIEAPRSYDDTRLDRQSPGHAAADPTTRRQPASPEATTDANQRSRDLP